MLKFKIIAFVVVTLAVFISSCGAQEGSVQSPDEPVYSEPNISPQDSVVSDQNPNGSSGSSGSGIVQSPDSGGSEPIGEWQTYVDQELGFTLDYPQLYIPTVNPQSDSKSDPKPIRHVVFQESLGDTALTQFDIEVYENSDGITLEKWLDTYAPNASRTTATIGNISGYHVVLNIEISPNEFYYIMSGSYIYKITPQGQYAQEILKSFQLK